MAKYTQVFHDQIFPPFTSIHFRSTLQPSALFNLQLGEIMRHLVDASMDHLSKMAGEVHKRSGFPLEDMIVLCLDPNSGWREVIDSLSLTVSDSYGFAFCVIHAFFADEITKEIPKLKSSLQRPLPPGHVRVIALSTRFYVCHMEVIPTAGELH